MLDVPGAREALPHQTPTLITNTLSHYYCHARARARQGLAKAMLDVPDNLERAAAVAREALLKADDMDRAALLRLTTGLLEGVELTDRVLVQVRAQGFGTARVGF